MKETIEDTLNGVLDGMSIDDIIVDGLNEPFIELYLGDRDFVIGLIKHYGVWERF